MIELFFFSHIPRFTLLVLFHTVTWKWTLSWLFKFSQCFVQNVSSIWFAIVQSHILLLWTYSSVAAILATVSIKHSMVWSRFWPYLCGRCVRFLPVFCLPSFSCLFCFLILSHIGVLLGAESILKYEHLDKLVSSVCWTHNSLQPLNFIC